MERYVGKLLLATAAVHLVVGEVATAGPLAAVGRAGGVNAVEPHPDRMAAVWFMLLGVVLGLLGGLTDWAQAERGRLPASLGWDPLGLGALGAALMPASGFWLALPQGLLALRAARRPAG